MLCFNKSWLANSSKIITTLLLLAGTASAQQVVLKNEKISVLLDNHSGRISYRFASGVRIDNTVAYVEDLHAGYIYSTDFAKHTYQTTGTELTVAHSDAQHSMRLIQHITLHASYLTTYEEITDSKTTLETRNISPLTGQVSIPGNASRILDVPFDNDNWCTMLERQWPNAIGISYEYAAVYDNNNFAGLVTGSVTHDFWKTGIAYHAGNTAGVVDSFRIFGGVATADIKGAKAAYGGSDGTHDHAQHGTMVGHTLKSPVIFVAGTTDIRQAFKDYGNANVAVNGRLQWKGDAPVYWNSFGVEDVLGHKGVMMPQGVRQVSDFIHTLDNFNRYGHPVLSIDSYDQGIYSKDTLAALGRYGAQYGQQMGFYFIPFAVWMWKDNIGDRKFAGTETPLKDVVLRDTNNAPIMYKDGDWGACAIDPTHPAIREAIIKQLQKAKAIHATFLKIDFLTAGALESTVRYNKNMRTGMQAYNYGMKMLHGLIDSILGPDIFITQAISPMFPYQYTHTRFLSTDVYSHLRDDQPGFPNWGSTEASLATGSHLGWVQGTLWPYTNLDVAIMQRFQNNPNLTEQEIKVRLYAMMTMGSILGDGSDLRQPLAAARARKFLNNAALCKFFSAPRAFTALKMADGETFDQQLAFYLKGDTTLLSLFNFDTKNTYTQTVTLQQLGLKNGQYVIVDFLSGEKIGETANGVVKLTVGVKDAVMVKLIAK